MIGAEDQGLSLKPKGINPSTKSHAPRDECQKSRGKTTEQFFYFQEMELMAAPRDGFGSGGKNNPHNNQQKMILTTRGLNWKWRQRGGCNGSGSKVDQDNYGSNK